MNARTTMSAKGQVVIPKDVRDRLGLVPGGSLEIIEMAGGILLKTMPQRPKRTLAEVQAELRALIQYEGPPVSVEDMPLTDEDFRYLVKTGDISAGD